MSPMICSGCQGSGFEIEITCADAGFPARTARAVAGGLHLSLRAGVGVHHVVFQDAAFGPARCGAWAGLRRRRGRVPNPPMASPFSSRKTMVPSSTTVMFSPGDLFAEHAAEEEA